MAFDAKYLACTVPGTGNFPAQWEYRDTAAASSVRAAGYIATRAGFRVGDRLTLTQVDNQETPTSITAVTQHIVVAVATATGYPDLSDGTTIAMTNT